MSVGACCPCGRRQAVRPAQSSSPAMRGRRNSGDDLPTPHSGDGDDFSPTMALSRRLKEQGESQAIRFRKARFNNATANADKGFPANTVVTSKYTFATFVPKTLFEQFRRVANLYFLLISLLQLFTDLSPTSKYTTAGPLLVVVTISGVKELVEDLKRHRADNRVNNSIAWVLDNKGGVAGFKEVLWSELRVGDIVRVEQDEEIPADMVLLGSSNSDRIGYVDTSNLDGENNLKLRQCVRGFERECTASSLSGLEGEVKFEDPSAKLYHFWGSMQLQGQRVPMAVSNANVLLRGTVLRNTKRVFGFVVYTGPDTKASMNSRAAPSKQGRLDKVVNSTIVIIFGVLFVMCSAGMVASQLWLDRHLAHRNYLRFLPQQVEDSGIGRIWVSLPVWVTDLILFNNLVPISLYVSLELVRWYQARQIDDDPNMREHAGVPARAHTSNLNEDLGSVEYIFSDKTGTLTENKMRFRCCYIDGITYGDFRAADSDGEDGALSSRIGEDIPVLDHTAGKGMASEIKRQLSKRMAANEVRHTIFDEQIPAPFHIVETDSNNSLSVPETSGLITSPSIPGSNTATNTNLSTRSARVTPSSSMHNVLKDASAAMYVRCGDFVFEDPRLLSALQGSGRASERAKEFWLCVVLCHSVIPTRPDGKDGELVYEASSPDEAALLVAARSLGFCFWDRSGEHITIKLFDELHQFELLATNEFTSDRKRMSVVVRTPDGKVVVYCKGADSVLLPRLRKDVSVDSFRGMSGGGAAEQKGEDRAGDLANLAASSRSIPVSGSKSSVGASNQTIGGVSATSGPDQMTRDLEDQLHEFASVGLRTLVLARRTIEDDFVSEWLELYHDAANSLVNRGSALSSVASLVELEMDLLGATAIEDQLQSGVPATIASLAAAGIKLWMLTGDKEETAVNIARSCGLLTDTMFVATLNQRDDSACREAMAAVRGELRSRGNWHPGQVCDSLALVVDGAALGTIIPRDADAIEAKARNSRLNPRDPITGVSVNPEDPGFDPARHYLPNPLHLELLELAHQCKAVVACRVSPLQKAQLVKLIRDKVSPEPVTLAIGDGANDVSMLQEAHVGIGVSGKEGMQAVRASDYSISQFRFLRDLLLLHGRWNRSRSSKLVLYSFYKNIAMILTLFLFTFYNAASGTTLFESWLGAGWNVGWTFLPILFIGVYDRDVTATTAREFPLLYQFPQASVSKQSMALWVLNATVHGSLVFIVGLGTFLSAQGEAANGQGDGLWPLGAAINWMLVLVVNGKVASITETWQRSHVVGLCVSILLWPLFVVCYSAVHPVMGFFRDFSGIAWHLFSRPAFWLAGPLILVLTLASDLLIVQCRRIRWPTPRDIVVEWDRGFGGQGLRRSATSALQAMGTSFRELVRPMGSNAALAERVRHVSERHFDGLLKQLLALRERVAAQAGTEAHAEPFDKSLYEDSIHPISHEFQGHTELEVQYTGGFFTAKAVTVTRVTLIAAIFLGAVYLAVEIVAGGNVGSIVVRGVLVLGGMALLWFTKKQFFVDNFQTITIFVVLVGGVSTTLIITDAGEFGQTLFHMLVFQVLRIRFANAVWVSFINTAVFAMFSVLNTHLDVPTFVIYLVLVDFYNAFGCYTLQLAMRHDFLQQRSLVAEKHRSEEVLANIMPPHVTQAVRFERHSDTRVISYDEPAVSILFCDIVDFASMSTRHSPEQLVRLMDRLYSLFDEVCRKHGVTKIETVGKTYMACSGLQGDRHDHAVAVVGLGLDMIKLVSRCRLESGSPAFEIRIGVHTGPIVAGVVGKKKPQFCLFGDTVNTSSRMQSTGEAMRVHCSPQAFKQIENVYRCASQTVWVKGKGDMTTYLVEGLHASRRAHPVGLADAKGVGNSTRMMSALHDAAKLEALEGNNRVGMMLTSTYGSDDGFSRGQTMKQIRVRTERNRLHVKAIEAERRQNEDQGMNLATLRFGNAEQERAFSEVQANGMAYNLRGVMFMLVVFNIFRLVSSATSQTGLSQHEVFVRGSVIVCSVIVALCVAFGTCADKKNVSYIYVAVGTVAVAGAGVAFGLAGQKGGDLGLDLMLLTSLAANGGVLPFLLSSCVNVITCAVALLYGVSSQRYSEAPVTGNEVFFVLAGIVLNGIAAWSTEYYIRRRFSLLRLTLKEADNANRMLYSMLPRALIRQLKDGRSLIADSFGGVSILFCDIVQFTSMSSRIQPNQVVSLLNKLFTALDKISDKYDVFKVQTIGDAYVMVAGLPYSDRGMVRPGINRGLSVARAIDFAVTLQSGVRRPSTLSRMSPSGVSASTRAVGARMTHLEKSPTQHALTMINVAFEMLQAIQHVKDPGTGRPIQMRIGIHTGSITAGVIGSKSLRYDMWGPDVLCANQMESNSEANRVLLSQFTYDLVKDTPGFNFPEHNPVAVKGMGTVRTRFVDPAGAEISTGPKAILRHLTAPEEEEAEEEEVVPDSDVHKDTVDMGDLGGGAQGEESRAGETALPGSPVRSSELPAVAVAQQEDDTPS